MKHKMFYEKISYVNKPVSRIFYGTASEVFKSRKDASDLLDAVFDLGINTFDTARVYKGSEAALGKWMANRQNRDKVVILSKGGHPDPTGHKRISEKQIREDFKISSEELQTDYIDIYILHRDDPEVPVGEIVELFNAMHEEGKIGAFGGSNWTYQRIEEANAYAASHGLIPFTVSSPNYGLAVQVQDLWGGGCVSISGPEHTLDRNWYRDNQMAIVSYSSLGRGLFSGKMKAAETDHVEDYLDSFAIKGYASPENFERLARAEKLAHEKGLSVPQIALAYLHSSEMNTFSVIHSKSPERMQSNIDALSVSLTENERDWLDLVRSSL